MDRGLPLVEVLRQHSDWLRAHGLLGLGKRSWAPITWSEWDLKARFIQAYIFPCTSCLFLQAQYALYGRAGNTRNEFLMLCTDKIIKSGRPSQMALFSLHPRQIGRDPLEGGRQTGRLFISMSSPSRAICIAAVLTTGAEASANVPCTVAINAFSVDASWMAALSLLGTLYSVEACAQVQPADGSRAACPVDLHVAQLRFVNFFHSCQARVCHYT